MSRSNVNAASGAATLKIALTVSLESALPDFYLSHLDLTGKIGNMGAIGPTGLPILMDTFVVAVEQHQG